jgi:hypothetical protein
MEQTPLYGTLKIVAIVAVPKSENEFRPRRVTLLSAPMYQDEAETAARRFIAANRLKGITLRAEFIPHPHHVDLD